MKLLLSLITVFLGLAGSFAAPPPPIMLGQTGAPTNGFWMTNVTFVYTNVAARTPTIDLGQLTVYSASALSNATVISWDAPTNALAGGLAGYRLYYGKTSDTVTNKFNVTNWVTCALFYSSLATNATWWAYATSVDTNGLESIPSGQVLFIPLK